jgi:hypothetical protein
LRKYHSESRESQESREKGNMRYIVKLPSVAILKSTDFRESRYKISVSRLIRSESRYKICLQEASLATKFLSARPVRSESRYKICLPDLQEVSLATKFLSLRLARSEPATHFNLQVSRESRGDFGSKKRVSLLARISKSGSRVNPSRYTSG